MAKRKKASKPEVKVNDVDFRKQTWVLMDAPDINGDSGITIILSTDDPWYDEMKRVCVNERPATDADLDSILGADVDYTSDSTPQVKVL
jgi:hypothetical protein